MADYNDKPNYNIPGEFFVDHTWIDCDQCPTIAPENFTRHDDDRQSYVFQQPRNPTERELCVEAMEACPTESIGQINPNNVGN
ncbi:MAG: ferredoxin [Sumerlaeia bacterium]